MGYIMVCHIGLDIRANDMTLLSIMLIGNKVYCEAINEQTKMHHMIKNMFAKNTTAHLKVT